jgi:hypothetical protein
MGEARKDALRLDFDRKLKLELYNSVSKTVAKRPGAPFVKLNGKYRFEKERQTPCADKTHLL